MAIANVVSIPSKTIISVIKNRNVTDDIYRIPIITRNYYYLFYGYIYIVILKIMIIHYDITKYMDSSNYNTYIKNTVLSHITLWLY
jgi:hypothetical protein